MLKTTLRAALALAAITSLAACSNKRAAEAVVREALKDPDSAKFGEFYYNADTKKGCLAVNARNAMGGYTGDQQAYVERTDKGWEVLGIGDVPLATCREVHADRTS